MQDLELRKLIDKLIDEKLLINDEYLRFSFYEVMVKGGVKKEQENQFLILAKTKLNNNRYIGIKDGKYYLLDGKKSVVADFSKTTNISMSSDTIRVIYDNRAYILDYNGVTLKEFEVPTGTNVTDYYNDTMIVTRRIETAGGGVYLEYNRIDKDNKVTCIGRKDITVTSGETLQIKYGTADVLNITIKDGYYIVETTSETNGNRVYTFYTYDGKELGTFDLTALSMTTGGTFSYRYGNTIFVKLGENCYKLNLK